jgi:hypothetical protein
LTVASKIAYLIEQGAKTENILALAFNQKAAEELKKQADELDKLADKYGALFPELRRLRDEHKALADEAERNIAIQTALAAAYEKSAKTLAQQSLDISELLAVLEVMNKPTSELANAFNQLKKAIDDHNASAEDAKPLLDALDAIIASSSGKAKELAATLRNQVVLSLNEVERAAKSAGETIKNSLNFQFPGAGGPLDLSPLTGQNRVDLLNKSLGDAADAIDGFTERVIAAEAPQGGPNLAGASSAFGPGQFINSTWLEVFKRNFAVEAAGMSDAAILALRSDLETNRRMIRAYATENARDLRDAGQEVTEATLQLAHFLGSGGAISVLQAAPGTRIRDIPGMGPAIAANPTILGGGATREDVLAFAERRTKATAAAREEKKPYDDLVASINAKTAAQQRENEISGDSSKSADEKTAALQREKAAQEAARVELELNNAALKQGLPLTDELRAKNHELAEAFAAAGLSADQLAEAQKKATAISEAQRQAAEQLKQQFEGVLGSALTGFAHDLQAGTDAGDAFANMLKNVASQLIDMAIQMMIVKPLMNALFPGAGGLARGFEAGGTVGLSGRSDGRKFSPLMWAGAPRYGTGGMVGLRPGEMPIIAHRGEIVVPNARRLAGVAGLGQGGQQRTVNVNVTAHPSPLLDLKIEKRSMAAEERAIARGPAVARNNSQRFAVP